MIAYFSCSTGERSWEVDELGHGLFFDQLIRGLQGEADVYPDDQITWFELVGYVQRNLNFYTAKYQGRKQTPHFKGEVIKEIPLVVRNGGAGRVNVDRAAPETKVKLAAGDVMLEDFRHTDTGALPRGWSGPSFSRHFDEGAGRACLEGKHSHGTHWLELPPFDPPLGGDFVFEVEFLMKGMRGYSRDHHSLKLMLQAEDGLVIPIKIDESGSVTFRGSNTKATTKFVKNGINRLRLVRTGNGYAVFLNDGDTASQTIPYSGAILAARFAVSVVNKDPCVTQIYSVKAASLDGAAGRRVPAERVALDEDFRDRDRGAVLPDGWQGTAFSIGNDEFYERRCLEVNKAEPVVHWLTLPDMAAVTGGGRPFYVEFDAALCDYQGYVQYAADDPGQDLHVRLEGPKTLPLQFTVRADGQARLIGDKWVSTNAFWAQNPNRWRIVHRDGGTPDHLQWYDTHRNDNRTGRLSDDSVRPDGRDTGPRKCSVPRPGLSNPGRVAAGSAGGGGGVPGTVPGLLDHPERSRPGRLGGGQRGPRPEAGERFGIPAGPGTRTDHTVPARGRRAPAYRWDSRSWPRSNSTCAAGPRTTIRSRSFSPAPARPRRSPRRSPMQIVNGNSAWAICPLRTSIRSSRATNRTSSSSSGSARSWPSA